MSEEDSPPLPPQQSGPPPPSVGPAHPGQSDATGGVIPYKNSKSLASYYCGVFSLIPVLGLLLGVVAIVLGILGWRDYRRNPEIRGQVHCWVGMIIGSIVVLIHLLLIIAMVSAMYA